MPITIRFFCNENADFRWTMNWPPNQPLSLPDIGDSASMYGHGRLDVVSRFFDYDQEKGLTVEIGLAYPKR